MANVQIENGYTKIANKILEHLAKMKLSPTQFRLILVIWRYTYGFERKQHELSLSFLSGATLCDKRQIQRELKELEARKIIVQTIVTGIKRVISFNKDYDRWISCTIGEIDIGKSTNGETINTTIGETVKGAIGETTNQERNILNKNIKKDTYTNDFEKFYSVYPRSEEKQRTFKNWKTCLKDIRAEELIQAGTNYKSKVIQAETDKQFIKTSANFLGREGFFKDYIEYEVPKEPKTRGW